MAVIDNFVAVKQNDDVIVSGTVDGVITQVHVWFSHLQQLAAATPGSVAVKKAAVKLYCANELKAQATRDLPPQPTGAALDLSGGPLTV